MKETIIAQDKEQLKYLIEKTIKLHGNICDLNHIDVSNVVNMNSMFFDALFNRDLSNWNVSNVKDMNFMFRESNFKQDLINWKPISLKNKNYIFEFCKAPTPYLAKTSDTAQLVREYEIKKMQKHLDSSLIDKNIKSNKIKI